MSKKWILTVLGILVLIASGLWYAVDHYVHLPEHITAMETIILGQSRYVPGSQAALRVVIRDLNSQSPIPNATVDVSLQPTSGGKTIKLYSGSTDAMGVADVSFQVPQDIDPDQQLIVDSSSDQGKDHLEQTINVNREYKILLSTDKPLYQPGQVIHLRALALSTFDLVPAAGQTIEFTIADGKGNKVFRQSTDTSAYGITAVDFQLASEVNTGPYKITAQMGNTSSEKTVTVERYVLPKFNLTWSTERSFYQPGSQVKGTLSAEYFFGKKVTNSEIIIEGFTFDFERQVVFTMTGQTDENGDFDFTFNLPDYLAGSDLEGGIARFYMQATVTDLAKHSEQSSFSLPVTQNQLIIQAIPESGQIRANVDNILYVITSYPDGAPAKTSLQVFIDGQQANQVETGDYGLAEVHFIPQSPYLDLRITARDVQGASAEQSFYFEGDWQEETVLLRPDHAVYQVGDTMQLEMLTSTPSGWVYLDIVREGQTVSTRSVEINNGHGNASVDLDPDLFGTLELHAYKILSSGIIVRDTRLVVIDSPSNLALAITPDKDEYRPGELSNIAFQIAGNDGTGAQAALGLAIVDESIFALAQQDPGFAKLYFMLEAELLQPKYDIHGFSVPDLLGTVPQEPGLQTAMEGAAQASLADAASAVSPFSLQLNSHDEKVELAYERQTAFFDALAKVLYGILLLISLTIISLVIISAIRMKALASSIALFFGFLLVLVLAIFLIPMPEWIGNQPLERLGYIIENLFINADIAIILIPLAGLVSFIGLAVYAIRAHDWNLGLAQILTFAFIPLLILLLFTAGHSALNTGNSVLIFLLIAFLLPPLAFLLRSMMFGVKRQIGWAVASFAVCMLMFMFPFALMASGPVSRGFGARMGALDGIANEAWDQGIMLEEAGIALPMMGPPDAHALKGGEDEETSASSEAPAPGEPPRLRQYFPETMYWQPEAITDENGYLNLEIPMADSITTWRLTALASTQDGRLGSATVGLRAFQDFFIDLDLPLALTQNDEISVPVGVFNYLTEAQTVRLVIEPDDWFELLDESEKEITIAANNIDVVYFRIKAKDFGRQPLQVTAYGSKLSDAILKEVIVYPDGKQITFSHSDILTPDGISQAVEIPDAAIPGTQKLLVKIYPGVVSQVVEGLEKILRLPHG